MNIAGNDQMTPWLEKALNLSYKRHTLLTSNIANVDTPNYKPTDLEFNDFLSLELRRPAGTKSLGMPTATPRGGAEPGLDGNMVDLDEEVVRMTANRLFYDLASEVVSRRLALTRYAIDEGGR